VAVAAEKILPNLGIQQWAKEYFPTKYQSFWSWSTSFCQTCTTTPCFSRVGGVKLKKCGVGGVEPGKMEWSDAKQALIY
jgi:hypothetical protein